METTVLFSYPRSGNTWLRYLIEVLSGRPTLGTPDNSNDLPIHLRHQKLAVDPEARPAALKRHTDAQLEPGDGGRPLIVVVRNYKEAILRVRHHSEESDQSFDLEKERLLYFQPIRYFDEHRRRKRMFFYEDLITRPAETIGELASFIRAPEGAAETLVENYEVHRNRSLRNYDAVSGSHTLGETAIHHSLKLTGCERETWDKRMEALEPVLFGRYLSRYQENRVVRSVP